MCDKLSDCSSSSSCSLELLNQLQSKFFKFVQIKGLMGPQGNSCSKVIGGKQHLKYSTKEYLGFNLCEKIKGS